MRDKNRVVRINAIAQIPKPGDTSLQKGGNEGGGGLLDERGGKDCSGRGIWRGAGETLYITLILCQQTFKEEKLGGRVHIAFMYVYHFFSISFLFILFVFTSPQKIKLFLSLPILFQYLFHVSKTRMGKT